MRLQDQARMDQQAFAIGGQRQGMRIAHEEAATQALFQAADVIADGRLGQPELAPAR
jgi:hypothetical protein